ncbi:hypothetical protein QQ045_003353 [Rhodiola kirilowii]
MFLVVTVLLLSRLIWDQQQLHPLVGMSSFEASCVEASTVGSALFPSKISKHTRQLVDSLQALEEKLIAFLAMKRDHKIVASVVHKPSIFSLQNTFVVATACN